MHCCPDQQQQKNELHYNCGLYFFLKNFNNDAYGTFSLVENRQLSSSSGLLGVHPIMQQAFVDT